MSAAFSCSSPAFTYTPSAHRYTTFRDERSCCFHCSYSSCHFAFSRPIDDAESGAPSPSNPRSASSKSPLANPCRYNSGNIPPSSFDLRLKNGITLLSNCSSVPLTRGRCTLIVPFKSANFFALPCPFQYPRVPSTGLILSDFFL